METSYSGHSSSDRPGKQSAFTLILAVEIEPQMFQPQRGLPDATPELLKIRCFRSRCEELRQKRGTSGFGSARLRTGATWAKHCPVGEFDDATLVLFGHGSTVNSDTAAPVLQHVQDLVRRRVFAEVRPAFWKQAPFLSDVRAALRTPRAFFVPFFISEGYFTEEIIPRALGFRSDSAFERLQKWGGRTLFYTRPVGTHGHMADVLLARAQHVVRQFPFPHLPPERNLTLFIAGHGTEQNENSRAAIEQQVRQLGELGRYAAVHAIYIEEKPRISECYSLSKTRHLVIVPFFVSDGMHVREDIPVLLGEPKKVVEERIRQSLPTWRNPTEKNWKLVWYSSSVGSDALMCDVILDRVREAAGGKV